MKIIYRYFLLKNAFTILSKNNHFPDIFLMEFLGREREVSAGSSVQKLRNSHYRQPKYTYIRGKNYINCFFIYRPFHKTLPRSSAISKLDFGKVLSNGSLCILFFMNNYTGTVTVTGYSFTYDSTGP